MKNKVNFVERWDKDGTHYNQGINITRQEWHGLKMMLDARKNKPKDYYTKLYLNSEINDTGNIVFINLTQRDFFAGYLDKYLSRPLLDRNTYLIIK